MRMPGKLSLCAKMSEWVNEEGDLTLYDDSSKLSLRPIAIAVGTTNFATAAQLLQSMEQE